MSAPNKENKLTLPDGVKVHAQPNGARILQFTEDVQVGVSSDNRVISATPGGWAFVVESSLFTKQTYRMQCEQTGLSNIEGAEFYAPHE